MASGGLHLALFLYMSFLYLKIYHLMKNKISLPLELDEASNSEGRLLFIATLFP